jgi:hypothetical protein
MRSAAGLVAAAICAAFGSNGTAANEQARPKFFGLF